MLIGMNQVEEVIRMRTALDDPANKRARGELYGDRVWWEAISKGVLSYYIQLTPNVTRNGGCIEYL